jgi:GT2 family glycosyltransferase
LKLAPVALFVYNRPRHTELTLEALRNNYLSDQSELFIFSDGPKINCTEEQLSKILEVRKIIAAKKWCKTVNIIESDTNKGLASAIVDGINWVFLTSDKIIVLEDDLITSKGFLQYMNEALKLFLQIP